MKDYFSPEDLFEAAKLGKKLKPKERLQVVVWLETSGEIQKYPEIQIANIFGCRVQAIKRYRQRAKEELAQSITTEQAMNYMADFLRSLDLAIKECKDSLTGSNAQKNCGLHQGYLRLLKELEAEKIEKLQSIGVIPKELGRLTTITEEWVAEVSEEGVASVRQSEDPVE